MKATRKSILRRVSIVLFACAFGHGHAGAVLDPDKTIVFQDSFRAGLTSWTYSVDDSKPASSGRVTIVPAPGLLGQPAVKFDLHGAPGTFRSEIALFPAEDGLQERWYGQSVLLDRPPVDKAGYIVMQWHALLGKEKVDRNFPNLSIVATDRGWVIRQAYGSPADIKRDIHLLPGGISENTWVAWVVRAKWSEGSDGSIQIYKDGKIVWDVNGPNVYTLKRDRTPYYKTGIYRPSRKGSSTAEAPFSVYVRDFRMGRHDAGYGSISPSSGKGVVQSFTNKSTRKCLDVAGGASQGNRLATYPCGSQENQLFRYSISTQTITVGHGDDLCLAAPARDQGSIIARPCDASSAQRWAMDFGHIRSLGSQASRCLTVGDKHDVRLQGCFRGNPNQEFFSNPKVALINNQSLGCVDVQSGVAVGRKLVSYQCSGSENQAFTYNGETRQLQVGGLCVTSAGSFDRAPVTTQACNGQARQTWEINMTGHICNLSPTKPQYCLDLDQQAPGEFRMYPYWAPATDQWFTPL